MDQLIPSIQAVIASSTSNMVTFAGFLFPVIAFTFGVVAAVGVIVFVTNSIVYLVKTFLFEKKMESFKDNFEPGSKSWNWYDQHRHDLD